MTTVTDLNIDNRTSLTYMHGVTFYGSKTAQTVLLWTSSLTTSLASHLWATQSHTRIPQWITIVTPSRTCVSEISRSALYKCTSLCHWIFTRGLKKKIETRDQSEFLSICVQYHKAKTGDQSQISSILLAEIETFLHCSHSDAWDLRLVFKLSFFILGPNWLKLRPVSKSTKGFSLVSLN
jgi:hypothetical protein